MTLHKHLQFTQLVHSVLPNVLVQAHHQQAHRREPRRLLLPQHLFPHGHLQVRPLRDRQPPGGRGVPAGAPGRDHGAGASRGGRGQQRGQTVPIAGEDGWGKKMEGRWTDVDRSFFFFFPVDLLRYPLPGRVHPGQVCRGDGRPSVGHPHGAALRHADWRRDEKAQHSHPAGWRLPLPLGHRQVTETIRGGLVLQHQDGVRVSHNVKVSLN